MRFPGEAAPRLDPQVGPSRDGACAGEGEAWSTAAGNLRVILMSTAPAVGPGHVEGHKETA